MTVSREDVLKARHELSDIEDAYLKQWGWKCTSHTPGSYWLYVRSFEDYDKKWDKWNAKVAETGRGSPHKPYGTLTCDRVHALKITLGCLDEPEYEDD